MTETRADRPRLTLAARPSEPPAEAPEHGSLSVSSFVRQVRRLEHEVAALEDRHFDDDAPPLSQLVEEATVLFRLAADLRDGAGRLGLSVPVGAALGSLEAVQDWLRGFILALADRPMPPELQQLLGVGKPDRPSLRVVEDQPDR